MGIDCPNLKKEVSCKSMNTKNLHALIDKYEENYYMINGSGHDEKFKWAAVRGFRDVWFSEESKGLPFSKKFDLAMKHSSIMINNSIISPTNGIVKMAEERPEEIESLFTDLLYASYSSVEQLQDHMDIFLDKTEEIRQKLFPRFYRYKQDRHAASCYLAFFSPENHYIYRYSDAEEFALHIEYGKDLGSGSNFSLSYYYEMADRIVCALKEHPSLIEKYNKLFKDSDAYYYDESLHLMAFDLMYCCRCYNFYDSMKYVKKKDSIKAYTAQQLKEKELAERRQRIEELETAIHQVDVRLDTYRDFSLLGVEVTQPKYGTGVVVEQNGNKIRVQFENTASSFIINNKYLQRPCFEDDGNVVDAFTVYDDLLQEKQKLEKELEKMQMKSVD